MRESDIERRRAYYREFQRRRRVDPEERKLDAERQRIWYRKNAERIRAKKKAQRSSRRASDRYTAINTRAKAGGYAPIKMSREDFIQWFNSQDLSLCGFCGERIRERPTVDHCHLTGEIRGIVHFKCNVDLGKWDAFTARNFGDLVERYRRKDE